jgi:hypothetical protein
VMSLVRTCLCVQFALELFSGAGGFSKAWREKCCWPVIEIDVRFGEKCDLRRKALVSKIFSWLAHGWVVAVWIGTPCASWSRARRDDGGPPPLRDDGNYIWGLPQLPSYDVEKVQAGNAFARLSARVLRICHEKMIPGAIENPGNSRLWLCPPIARLILKPEFRCYDLDMCGFGTAWKKSTRILAIFADLSSLERRCSGAKPFCSFSQKKHILLTGSRNGVWKTRLAEIYPPDFCVRAAAAMVYAASACSSQERRFVVGSSLDT